MRDAIHDYLLERPSGATVAELMDLIFTKPGSDPEMGPRFIGSLLGADPRFSFDAQVGRWRASAHGHLSESLAEATFVVVDLETTGGGPANGDAIIEIGAVKVRGGQIVGSFDALVHPGRSLPRFITRLTGITDEMLADAPSIEQVLPEFAEFAGEHVLVAHNARFDRGFLDAAWRRVLDRPVQQNFLCTLRLARRLLPNLRRRSLDALAGHYGIVAADRHRALGDARITTEVLFQFLEALPLRGVLSVAEALDFQGAASDGRRFFCLLPRNEVSALPRTPGIYRFFDEDGELLYIGKAGNLHQRVSSYLSNSKSHSKKTLDLIRHIRSLKVEETGSELEASLLEAEQIRLHKPPYNVLRKHLPRIAYLKLSVADRFPRLSLATRPTARRSRYFGPFRGRAHAERAYDALVRAFHLRTCAGRLHPAEDVPPCFQGQIGNCTKPCDTSVGEDSYRLQVEDFLRFFDDGDSAILDELATRRDKQSDATHFESAARVQRDIELLRHLARRQQQMSWVIEQHHFAVVQPAHEAGAFLLYIVVHGRLVERMQTGSDLDLKALAESVDQQLRQPKAPALAPEEVDGTTILAAWLRDRGDRDGYVIPIEEAEPNEEGRLPEWTAALAVLLADGADPLLAGADPRRTQALEAPHAEQS